MTDLQTFLTFDDICILPGRNRGSADAVSTASQVSRNVRLSVPLLSAGMPSITETAMAIAMGEFGGLGVIHRYTDARRQCEQVAAVARYTPDPSIYPDASTGPDGRLIAAASVAPTDLDQAWRLAQAGAKVLFLDTPNPSNDSVFHGAAAIREALSVDLVIGSVVEHNTARRYLGLGVDAIKVGLGAGALCTMRRTTGVGAPQVGAIQECAALAREYGVPVIADGGVRTSGDVVKALAVGASGVMLGSLLAGCDEAPGDTVHRDGRRMKQVKGLELRSLEFDVPTGYPAVDAYLADHEPPRVEGGDALVPASGPCHLTLLGLVRGIRGGIHLAGATSATELRSLARVIRTSPAGIAEAGLRAPSP